MNKIPLVLSKYLKIDNQIIPKNQIEPIRPRIPRKNPKIQRILGGKTHLKKRKTKKRRKGKSKKKRYSRRHIKSTV